MAVFAYLAELNAAELNAVALLNFQNENNKIIKETLMGFFVCVYFLGFFFFYLNPLHEKSQEGKGNG